MSDDQSHSLPPTQSASLEAGQRVFRHYVLHRFLGRGALGASWLVVHEGHGRELAMRFVPEAWLRDERVMSALRDAVVKLLEITHHSLVGVLDFVRDPQAAAVVTRFVEGKTLNDVRANAPEKFLPVSMVQAWMAELCEALDFAWERHKAIHGDLCPQNLLVTDVDEFRVLDFGLARSLYDVPGPTGAPLLTGTQGYLSPERARGMSVTVADDVYGFGATVYELLTSRPVFFRGNLLWQLESVVPPSMAERRAEFGITDDPIPPEWEEVVAACLAKSREDRPRDLREVGERLGLLTPKTHGSDAPAPIVLPRSPDLTAPIIPPVSKPATPPIPFSSSSQTVAIESETMGGELEDFEVTQDAAQPVSPTASTQSAPPDDDADQTVAGVEPPPPLPAPAAATLPPPATPPTPPPPPKNPPPPKTPPPPPLPPPPPTATAAPPPLPPPVPATPPPLVPAAAPPPPPPPAAAAPTPAPAPPPVKVQVPPPPPTHVPGRTPAQPSAPAPISTASALRWLVPAGLCVGVVIVAVALALFFRLGKHKGSIVDTPTPTPIPATPTPAPATPTPRPVQPTPTPITPAPVQGREVTASSLATFANQGPVTEMLFLTGEFRVSSAIDRVAIVRPTAKDLSGKVRVSVRFPQGTTLPAEGSTVQWTRTMGLQVREVRRGNDGQLNIDVEKTGKP